MNSELSPLATKDNQAVHTFPANLGALKALSSKMCSSPLLNLMKTNTVEGDATTELLGAYDLSDQGTLAEKKRRFRSFIGVVADIGCDEDIIGVLAEMALE